MQYVGARYVPKFMGLYDATQAYEALCVVDNGMGTSYITKVPTPAGTPLTDTDYYAVYGASSGAIINLQNQIGDLNNLTTSDQDSLVDAINEVNAGIQTLSNRIITPEQFGAVGDGVTDDSTAINNMIDSLRISGGAILLTANYLIQNDIVIHHSGSVSSEHTPIVIYGGKNGKLIFDSAIIKGASNMSGGVRFIGVTFEGASNSSDTLLATDDSLRKMHFIECKFENFKSITNLANSSLADDWIFDGCNIFKIGGSGFSFASSICITLENCYITADENALNTIGIDCTGSTENINLNISNCIFEHFADSAIKLNNKQKNTHIHDCYLEDNTKSIDLSNCTAADDLQNVIIENNYIVADSNQISICLPLSFLSDTDSARLNRTPISIINNKINPINTGKGLAFDGAPSVGTGGIKFKVFPRPGDTAIEQKIVRYDWMYKEVTYNPTGTEAANTPITIMTSADFATLTNRSDPTEFFIHVKRARNPIVAYRDGNSYDIVANPLTNITSTQTITFIIGYRN